MSKIDARMVARPRGLEDDDIAGAESRAFDALACLCLFARHAGHAHAVLGAGPVHEAGAVEAAPGGYSALGVRLAQLTASSGRYGVPGSRGMAGIVGAGMTFAASRKENERQAQEDMQEESLLFHKGSIHVPAAKEQAVIGSFPWKTVLGINVMIYAVNDT